VATRVRSQVKSCGICGRRCSTGADILRILRFPLPVLVPHKVVYIHQLLGLVQERTKWIQSHPTHAIKKKSRGWWTATLKAFSYFVCCSKSKSHCNWPSVSLSWCRASSGAHDQIFLPIWKLLSSPCGAPSDERCLLLCSPVAYVSKFKELVASEHHSSEQNGYTRGAECREVHIRGNRTSLRDNGRWGRVNPQSFFLWFQYTRGADKSLAL
jgi:hypothetical protein